MLLKRGTIRRLIAVMILGGVALLATATEDYPGATLICSVLMVLVLVISVAGKVDVGEPPDHETHPEETDEQKAESESESGPEASADDGEGKPGPR